MKQITAIIILITLVFSCKEEEAVYPKPLGYYRVFIPDSVSYKSFNNQECGYSYNYPSYAKIINEKNCNQSIVFPYYKAKLYVTSIKLDNTPQNNFFYHSEFSRKLAYEHRVKADRIDEKIIKIDSNMVYGVSFFIEGDVASNFQFFITDSSTNFYRGSLYFETETKIDSIKPILEFLKQDIEEMITTFKWNK